MRVDLNPKGLVSLRAETRTQTHSKGRPCEDTWKEWPLTGQGERCQEKLLTPRAWTSWIRNTEKK